MNSKPCRSLVALVLVLVGGGVVASQDALEKLEKGLDVPLTAPETAPPPQVGELPEPAPPPANPPAAATGGSRAGLGISVSDVKGAARQRFALTVDAGAVITQIRQGSPAARAGLPLGGVIVSVNGKRIGSADDLVTFIQAFRPGDTIEVTYFEGDRIGRKRLTLAPAVTAPPASVRRAPRTLTTDPSDPPLRLGARRPGNRPVLDALERALDTVLPPPPSTDGAAGTAELPTPPPPPARASELGGDVVVEPPPPPPAAGANPADGPAATGEAKSVLQPDPLAPPDPDEELAALRRQMESLKQQLEQVQRRINELEEQRKK